METNKSYILVVQKGFQTKSEKFRTLIQDDFSEFDVQIPEIPEPFDDIETCVTTISNCIKQNKPKLILASSRGGKVVAQLIGRGIYKGPFLLISSTNVKLP